MTKMYIKLSIVLLLSTIQVPAMDNATFITSTLQTLENYLYGRHRYILLPSIFIFSIAGLVYCGYKAREITNDELEM